MYHQIKLPLDIEISIPSDDPVRLVSAFVEEMDLSDLYKTYDRIRKNQASLHQMLKIVIYAAMNKIYSSRDIESFCKRDINFMYLLDGAPAPDHSTIARFISIHLSQCAKRLMAQVGTILLELGEISGENIFIDGTKIESVANKYTFVWKRAVSKNMINFLHTMSEPATIGANIGIITVSFFYGLVIVALIFALRERFLPGVRSYTFCCSLIWTSSRDASVMHLIL
nr:transposase [Butyrivibrio sp. AE3004]